MSEQNYTCPDCGRTYDVRPKACVCERDVAESFTGDIRYYVVKVLDTEGTYDLHQEMLSLSSCRGIDYKTIGEEEAVALREGKPPVALYDEQKHYMVEENLVSGVETPASYERSYYAISAHDFTGLTEV